MSDTSPNAVPQTTYDYLVALEHALCNRQPCLDLISTLRAELPQGPEQRFLNQLHNDLTTVSTVDQLISHRFAAIWIPLLLQSQNSNSSPRSLKRMLSLVSLESSLARQRRNANLYPLALTLLSCTILIVACATIVPVFTVMYDDFQMHQPLATLWLTGFSRQLVEHPLIVSLLVIFVIAAFFTLRRLWLQFELTQRWFGRIMPARIDGLAKVAAFSGSVAELIPHHVPVPVALQISAKYANSPIWKTHHKTG